MFCEDPEELQMISYLATIYPESDEHILDLMVWCYRHRNKAFLELLDKYEGYEGIEEQMVRVDTIDYDTIKKATALPPADIDDAPVFDETGSFCEGKDGAVCDSCGS